MQSIKQFIEQEGLTGDVEYADSNPNMDDLPDASHWLVTIRKGDASIAIPFSQGFAIQGEPDVGNMLDCLASDASTIEDSVSFDGWAQDLGFFPMESRQDYLRAERIYAAINEQSKKLRQLLGEEAYQRLLYDTERL